MNKKGQIELGSSYVIIISIVFFVIIIFGFFILFSFKNGSISGETIKSQNFDELVMSIELMNFLKTPIEVNGEKMLAADVIARVDVTQGEQARREAYLELAKEIFESKYPDPMYHWWLRVFSENEYQTQYFFSNSKYDLYGVGDSLGILNLNCNDDYYFEVKNIKLPKIDGQEIRLVFCAKKDYILNLK